MAKRKKINVCEVTEKHFKNRITEIEPKDFELQYTTMWSFPRRGSWATHRGDYRGNWAPEIPRNIILRYSKKKDVVLDPFVGSGTTLIECRLLNRFGIGIDINPNAIKLAKNRIIFKRLDPKPQLALVGDARNLKEIEYGGEIDGFERVVEKMNGSIKIKDNSVDLICAHPPYADAIQYASEEIEGDLSYIHDIDEFQQEIRKSAKECFRVLKPNKHCAVLIGDIRRKKHVIPVGFKVMSAFQETGFILKEIVIKQQHQCKTTPIWKERSKKFNFLLLAHEYLFVFRKPEK